MQSHEIPGQHPVTLNLRAKEANSPLAASAQNGHKAIKRVHFTPEKVTIDLETYTDSDCGCLRLCFENPE